MGVHPPQANRGVSNGRDCCTHGENTMTELWGEKRLKTNLMCLLKVLCCDSLLFASENQIPVAYNLNVITHAVCFDSWFNKYVMHNNLFKPKSRLYYSAFQVKFWMLWTDDLITIFSSVETTFSCQILCSQMNVAKVRMFLCFNENSPSKIAVYDLFISQNHFRAKCRLKAKRSPSCQ